MRVKLQRDKDGSMCITSANRIICNMKLYGEFRVFSPYFTFEYIFRYRIVFVFVEYKILRFFTFLIL